MRTTRRLLLAGALVCAATAAPTVLAQHGGGPPGGGGGGGFGGIGGPHGGGIGGGGIGGIGGGIGRGNGAGNVPASRPSGPQLGLPGRWWDERKTIKTLGLRGDQKQRMDDIFASNKPTLMMLLGNLQHEQDALASLSSKDRKDEATVFAAINRVETARGELAKETAHMQLQIRQQLDADQVAKLDAAIASQH